MISGFIWLVVITGVLADIHCPNDKLTPEMRQQFVDAHNKLRSELAHGKTKGKGGVPLPGAKDMLELGWNCKLEERSQKWSDNCKFKHSTYQYRKGAGENLYAIRLGGRKALERMAKKVPELSALAWWSEANRYNVTLNPEIKLTMPIFNWGVGHFTQMAWANTFQVGCGIGICETEKMVMVTCEYWTAGNYMGAPIYKEGHACTKDSECHTNKCNVSNGLCIHEGGPEYK